jgi:hypothetical protein
MSFGAQLYCCAIDGLCYESRDAAMAHMRMQHNIRSNNPSLLREKVW